MTAEQAENRILQELHEMRTKFDVDLRQLAENYVRLDAKIDGFIGQHERTQKDIQDHEARLRNVETAFVKVLDHDKTIHALEKDNERMRERQDKLSGGLKVVTPLVALAGSVVTGVIVGLILGAMN